MDNKTDREGQSRISQILSWAGPRTVVVPRSAQGFGFTLRHFVVYPPESASRSQDWDGDPWQSDAGPIPEPLDTIFVKNVREGSAAHLASLTAGDRIVAVNGEPVSGKTYADVISLIHASNRSLKLLVVPRDEDILQMAYQSQSADPISGSRSSIGDTSASDMQDSIPSGLHKTSMHLAVSGQSSHSIMSGSSRYTQQSPRHTTYASALQETERSRRDEFGRLRPMREDAVSRRTSQPHAPDSSSTSRPMSQDSGLRLAGGVPSRAKYSFGLYFPPQRYTSVAGSHSRTTSADNLSHSSSAGSPTFRAGSESSSSTSGLDSVFVGSSREVAGNKMPSPRHSFTQNLPDYSRGETRYYVPVLNQSNHSADYSSGYSGDSRTRQSVFTNERNQRPSLGSTVTVSTGSAGDRSMSRSSIGSTLGRTGDSVDGGGSGGASGQTTFVVRIPMSGTSSQTPTHSYGSSFAVTRSPRHQTSTTLDLQRQSPSHSTTIEVQAGPPPSSAAAATHIVEVQHQSPGPADNSSSTARSVWQRKVLFENGQNENNPPSATSKVSNRHRTELEKLTSQRKFTSVAARMASFEKSSDEDGDIQGRENTPPTQPPPQPAIKVRRVSLENCSGERDSDSTGSDSLSSPAQLLEAKTEAVAKEEPSVNTQNMGTPARTFFTPTSRSSLPQTSPPVVEIVPVITEKSGEPTRTYLKGGMAPLLPAPSVQQHQPPSQPVQVVQPIIREPVTRDSHSMPPELTQIYHSSVAQRPLSIHEWPLGGLDMDWQQLQVPDFRTGMLGASDSVGLEPPPSSRPPQRKSSYLSAVNAPSHHRYTLPPTSDQDEVDAGEHDTLLSFYLHPSSTSLMSTSDSAVSMGRCNLPLSSTPGGFGQAGSIESISSVVRRKKITDTAEDSMAKLHRRTSYLMATARDRSNNNVTNNLNTSYSHTLAIPEESGPGVTPSIVEATERSRSASSVSELQPESPLPDITREGPLWCKIAVSDGKKCSDRSWKQVWAVLRGHALFLIRDRREGQTPPTFIFEEPPISIKSCLVDIAHDYSRKRKNVFRLTTYSESVYLLQAEDKGTMMSWIQAIKINNNPDNDEEGIGSAELIRRKVSTQSDGGLQTSPQLTHREKEKDKEKDKPKKAVLSSLKGKFPHSPSVKRKKAEDGGGKKGGWKGLMSRSFKKQSADDHALAEEMEDISKCTFGIPLEDCFPSPNNEYVPLIVELCTRIVEARGLEVVGVYRVPGNSVAVSHIQEELNQGIENMNMDNDKWLDVNVISSLLKAFFRKLPRPLVTPELYDKFIEANRNPNPEKRMLKLKQLLHKLPEHHYETFKHLAEHLSTVAAHGLFNKMDAKNLAIMFGPTLIRKVEDDTASLVTDMSDQCRIIESVILHNDWFFSNWTQDYYVPIDSGEHTQPSGMDARIARDDDEDADSAINTKEIISSIVSAANKKLKLRQQSKSADSLDFETTLSQHTSSSDTSSITLASSVTTHSPLPTSDVVDGKVGGRGVRYQERNIDAAISRAATMTKSQNSLTSSRSASEEALDRRATTTAPLATSEPDFLDWEGGGESRGGVHYGSRGRHLSDDALLERSDEVVSGGWVGRDTLVWLKRLEQEARSIRRREEQRQRDLERHRRQQQAIERELQRSQRDLEMEDSQSVEDILARSSFSPSSTSLSSAWSLRGLVYPPPLHSAKSDTALGLKEHSNSSYSSHKPGAKGVDVRTRREHGSGSGASGGKYFVSDVNTCEQSSHLRSTTSMENLLEGPSNAERLSRTGSLENIDSPAKDFHAVGISGRRRGSSGALRPHGSLDSMLDMLGHDMQGGGSSDSEDGSDLLTSLTTTFDQKLQILLNPKYRLTSRHSRLPHSHSRHSRVLSGNSGHSGDSSQGSESGITQDWSRSKEGFRDPSLHRAAKSDTKVGIASRFEWGSTSSSSIPSNYSNTVACEAALGLRKPLPDLASFLARSPQSDSGSTSSCNSNNVLTQPRKLSMGMNLGSNLLQLGDVGVGGRMGGRSIDYRPISKSEKMEVNKALARLGKVDSSAKKVGESVGASENSVKKGHTMHPSPSSPAITHTAKPAPPTSAEDAGEMLTQESKRRHTVGGSDDLEHFKALLAVRSQYAAETDRPSAWEQLCPSPKDIPCSAALPQSRSLQAWMKSERLRGSTPDLQACSRLQHH